MKLDSGQLVDNRYEVLERLGEGGMGEVWKALDKRHCDEVVIKMPLLKGDPEIRARFGREAQVMREHSLDCPQILNIEDVGNLDGVPWYVMRYLPGGSVRDHELSKDESGKIRANDRSFEWLVKIASALDYLHQKQSFHRDVKPENILFSREGTPYLVDFGIVKTVDEHTSLMTEEGATIGTMAYMAPELLEGGDFVSQSDQFSLAVTLYEFLTREKPYGGTTIYALFKSYQNGHRKLSDLFPAIPQAASDVIDRALSREPKKRFDSCQQFAEAFIAGFKDTTNSIDQELTNKPDEAETGQFDTQQYQDDLKRVSADGRKSVVRGGVAQSQHELSGLKPDTPKRPWPLLLVIAAGLALVVAVAGVVLSGQFFPADQPTSSFTYTDDSQTQSETSEESIPVLNLPDEVTNQIGMKLRLIPQGDFMMGSPAGEAGRNEEGEELRLQVVDQPFYLATTEVTQSQWVLMMQTEPWKEETWGVQKSGLAPATFVSLDDAKTFCEKLSTATGQRYRLPTEIEWEYACRAGTNTIFSFDTGTEKLTDYAWHDVNSELIDEAYAHDVGLKKPNDFGLFDMHGNVWEWFTGGPTEKSGVRGGGWIFSEESCRSASRMMVPLNTRNYNVGFRVVRDIKKPK